tara:strand:+ start:186 stop:1316 length:1131 start_codon:yes stop_codon:yes gene_type:complete
LTEKETYLVITPFFPSENSFVGSYIYDQVNELRNQIDFDFEVIKVVTLFSNEKDYKFKGFNISIFKLIDIPFFIFPGIFNWINKKRFNFFLKNKNIKNIKLSHSHVSYPAAYLVEEFSCKKIVQHHGLDVLQLLNGRNNFIKRLQRSFLIKNTLKHLNKVDVNIGVAQLVLDKLDEFKEYNPKKEYVLYNGVDFSKFYPVKTENNEVFTIGCVANFWKIKNQITLIKAVKLLKDSGIAVQLRLIGSGPTLLKCKKFVRENNLSENILFEKELKHENLNVTFNEIDLFVMPSYYEALGCVYLESWATNTPFIAIKGQGIAELIPDNKIDFHLAKPKDPESLKNCIIKLMQSDDQFIFNNNLKIENTIRKFIKDIVLC